MSKLQSRYIAQSHNQLDATWREWRNHLARALLAKALKEGGTSINGKELGPK